MSGVAGSMYRAAAGYRDTPTPSPLRDCFAESLEIGNCSTFAARCGGVQGAGHHITVTATSRAAPSEAALVSDYLPEFKLNTFVFL